MTLLRSISMYCRIAQDWYTRLKLHEIDDSVIQIEATSEGLKVTFYGDDKPLFESSTPNLTAYGRKVMLRCHGYFPTCVGLSGRFITQITLLLVREPTVRARGKCPYLRQKKWLKLLITTLQEILTASSKDYIIMIYKPNDSRYSRSTRKPTRRA